MPHLFVFDLIHDDCPAPGHTDGWWTFPGRADAAPSAAPDNCPDNCDDDNTGDQLALDLEVCDGEEDRVRVRIDGADGVRR